MPFGVFWVDRPFAADGPPALVLRLPLFVWRMARTNLVTDDSRPRWWVWNVRVVLSRLPRGFSSRAVTFWSPL